MSPVCVCPESYWGFDDESSVILVTEVAQPPSLLAAAILLVDRRRKRNARAARSAGRPDDAGVTARDDRFALAFTRCRAHHESRFVAPKARLQGP